MIYTVYICINISLCVCCVCVCARAHTHTHTHTHTHVHFYGMECTCSYLSLSISYFISAFISMNSGQLILLSQCYCINRWVKTTVPQNIQTVLCRIACLLRHLAAAQLLQNLTIMQPNIPALAKAQKLLLTRPDFFSFLFLSAYMCVYLPEALRSMML